MKAGISIGRRAALAGAAACILSSQFLLAQEAAEKPKVVDMGTYRVTAPSGGNWDVDLDKKNTQVSFRKAKGTGMLSQMFPALGPQVRETTVSVFPEMSWPDKWRTSVELVARECMDGYTWESDVDRRGLDALASRETIDRRGKTLYYAKWTGPRFIRPGKEGTYGIEYFLYLYFPPDFRSSHTFFHFQSILYRPGGHPEPPNDPALDPVLAVIDSLEIADPLSAVPGPHGELLRAAAAGQPDGVRQAIEKGADVNASGPERGAVSVAAGLGRLEIVELHIERGAAIDAADMRGGRTPLLAATLGCEPEIAALLVGKGANVNRRTDALGRKEVSALMLAAAAGYPDLVRILIEAGADLEAKTDLGETPLALASTFNAGECVALLLEKGADGNSRMKDGQTPLIRAADYDRTEAVKILLEHKADPNAREAELGWTAVMMAVRNNNLEALKLLVDHGADVNIQETGEVVTALNGAVLMDKPKIVTVLLEAGADVNKRMKDGRTALMAASEAGSEEIVKLLIGKGADLEAKDAKGRTALKIATKNKNTRIVEVLKAAGAK